MNTQQFVNRHINLNDADKDAMLSKIGVSSVDELISQTIPDSIRLAKDLDIPEPLSEYEMLQRSKELAEKNLDYDTYIGFGYHNSILPSAIQRNILENPSWYTAYTPYQAEIAQGRLEALLNYQTIITNLTGFALANASLLDESTAASEAMNMFYSNRTKDQKKAGANKFFVSELVLPQTIAVLTTKAEGLGIEIVVGNHETFSADENFFGALLQYPGKNGIVLDYTDFIQKVKSQNLQVAVACDPLALVKLKSPAEMGADCAIGTTQRFGIPLGYGGPHAAFFACKEDYKRDIPGRIIGVSQDMYGKRALRMALQTREQHIKREKATSNICTAQVLLSVMAGMYAVYHGKAGLEYIADQIHYKTNALREALQILGYEIVKEPVFDTVKMAFSEAEKLNLKRFLIDHKINLNYFSEGIVSISLNETTTIDKINKLVNSLAHYKQKQGFKLNLKEEYSIPDNLLRKDEILTEEVFNKYHTETDLMRYIKRLERKDLSLTHSMISLGSCTMKLNAATQMIPLSWENWGAIHPLAPEDQTKGYQTLINNLSEQLKVITGFAGVTLQPNSGAAGEYTGLRIIRAYLESIGQGHRNKILIPASAHGTNPASAIQCGYTTVTCACDDKGNVDVEDLRAKAEANKDDLAALMITYPSTHGIFEPEIAEICKIIHKCGAQVYMDGANMNAQVGLTNPGTIGADVCHLNLHKTFASPHGGGGPGVGPVCVAEHLVPFLPGHQVWGNSANQVSSAPYGSAGILPITYGYICMMGAEGLTNATKTAILSANYLAACFKDTYGIVYTGATGFVGHEMILDCRYLHDETGISENDIAKRLMDYGYHAPTLSFPVHGTLMIEPTESESLWELDNFVTVMQTIWQEIQEVKNGSADKEDNVLVNAPHPEYEVVANEWNHSYSREKAAYPIESVRDNKFWINVARVDNTLGDRKLLPTRYGKFE